MYIFYAAVQFQVHGGTTENDLKQRIEAAKVLAETNKAAAEAFALESGAQEVK